MGREANRQKRRKEYMNKLLTREKVRQEIKAHLQRYHGSHVAPLAHWVEMPWSRRMWERAKLWIDRELTWPPSEWQRPWWWGRIVNRNSNQGESDE